MTVEKRDITDAPIDVTSGNSVKRTAGTAVSERELQERHRRFISAATSENTRRTYRSAIRHFHGWGGVLPCDSAAVLRYLLAYSDALNPRTLALRLTALSQWHLFQGFPDPAADPNVRKTLRGIARTNGKPKKKAKALPIEDLERMVATLSTDNSLIAVRNGALLQIAFFGALRRSEVAGLMVEDLAWEPDGLVVTLARSKTDQEGEGLRSLHEVTASRARLLDQATELHRAKRLQEAAEAGFCRALKLESGACRFLLNLAVLLNKLGWLGELSSHAHCALAAHAAELNLARQYVSSC